MPTSATSRRSVVLFVALALAIPILSLTRSPAVSTSTDSTFTFEGGGWGHGVGLSQYGAYAMSKAGEDRAAILAHYYRGTSIAKLGEDLEPAEPLWVNLEREIESVTLRAAGSGGVPLVVHTPKGDAEVPVGEAVTVAVTGADADGTPTCRVTTSVGFEAEGDCDLDIEWDGDAENPTTRVVLEHVRRRTDSGDGGPCTLIDWNAIPSLVRPCTYGRGVLHLRPDNDSSSFHVVVELDVEDYLLGISEMPYYWGEERNGGFAALQAQAIAARSYAIHRQIRRGDPERRTGCWCQVYDTTIDQRYVGWGHSGLGQATWLAAVRSTEGEVAVHPDETRNGKLIPIEAFYGSSSYGRTEPGSVIFGTSVPYLQAVDDPWSVEPTVRNPAGRWSKQLTAADLARALGWGGDRTVARVEVASCSAGGTIDEVRFVDENGDGEIRRARSLRSLLGLRSPQITNIGTPPPPVPPCGGLGVGVSLQDVVVDDDNSGDSVGNDDGHVTCGETVEVRTGISHEFTGSLTGVTMELVATDDHATVDHNASSPAGAIAAGGTAVNQDDWDITIGADVDDGHSAEFVLIVTADQGGPWTLDVALPVVCGAAGATTPPPTATTVPPTATVAIGAGRVDDSPTGDSIGNNDGVAQCGETIELYLTVENGGDTALTGLEATLRVPSDLKLLHNTASALPDLAIGAAGENRNDWDIQLPASTADGATFDLEVVVTDDAGTSWTLPWVLTVSCAGQPPAPSTPVAIAAITVDDGIRGDSRGNNDKVAQCGERIELYVALEAIDATVAPGPVTLTTDDAYLTLLYNTSSPYPELRVGAAKDNLDDWDIDVAADAPAGHDARFTLSFDVAGEAVTLPGTLHVECGGDQSAPPPPPPAPTSPVAVEAITVDDGVRGDSRGNNDKVAQCGERIELYVALTASSRLDGVRATLVSLDPKVTIAYNTASIYRTLGSTPAENLDDWDIDIAATTTDGHLAPLRLDVDAGAAGSWSLPLTLEIRCN